VKHKQTYYLVSIFGGFAFLQAMHTWPFNERFFIFTILKYILVWLALCIGVAQVFLSIRGFFKPFGSRVVEYITLSLSLYMLGMYTFYGLSLYYTSLDMQYYVASRFGMMVNPIFYGFIGLHTWLLLPAILQLSMHLLLYIRRKKAVYNASMP